MKYNHPTVQNLGLAFIANRKFFVLLLVRIVFVFKLKPVLFVSTFIQISSRARCGELHF